MKKERKEGTYNKDRKRVLEGTIRISAKDGNSYADIIKTMKGKD